VSWPDAMVLIAAEATISTNVLPIPIIASVA
jgi:hypothetical protein